MQTDWEIGSIKIRIAKIMGFFTVVPAHAGMIPDIENTTKEINSCTRTRGDDP